MTGRSGSEKRQRNYLIAVRLSEAEQLELAHRVELSGCSPAALIRHGIFDAPLPRAIPRPTVEHREVARLLAELGKIGSNINQLARHANAGRFQSNSIELAMRELLVLRSACLKALGHED